MMRSDAEINKTAFLYVISVIYSFYFEFFIYLNLFIIQIQIILIILYI